MAKRKTSKQIAASKRNIKIAQQAAKRGSKKVKRLTVYDKLKSAAKKKGLKGKAIRDYINKSGGKSVRDRRVGMTPEGWGIKGVH